MRYTQVSDLPCRATAFSVLFCVAGPSIARAAEFELPALNTPPSTEHHLGKMVWADLVTPDLAAAEKFYGGLFGWTFRRIRVGNSEYAVAMLDGRPIAGLVEKAIRSGERHQSAWLTFMAAGDVDAVKRVAVAHGAKVLVDTKSYPMRGRQCVVSDPEGAVFAILASSSGDPPDFLARRQVSGSGVHCMPRTPVLRRPSIRNCLVTT